MMTLSVSPASLQADADRLVAVLNAQPPGPAGCLRLEVVLDDGTVEARSVRFAADSVERTDDAPDVVLRLGFEDLAGLVGSTADGALLYLAGRLDVVGDEHLVLALGSALHAPGSQRSLIDAAALDPVAVSEAIAGASTEHLSEVMSGGFRDLVLGEVFRRLPDFLIAEKAKGVRVAVMFEIEGATPEHLDRFVVRVADGACTVQAGADAGEPVDATVVLAGHEFLRLVLGHLNPVRGVLSGQLRVRGQVLKALGFNSVMAIPGS